MEALEGAPWHEGTVYAWAAGEAEMLRPIRRWLKDVEKFLVLTPTSPDTGAAAPRSPRWVRPHTS